MTVTSTAPAVPKGVEQVSEVAELNTTEVQGDPPTSTVAPFTKLVPVIVIDVPAVSGPEDGATVVTVGAGKGVTEFEAPDEDEVPPALVAVTENV